MMEFKVGGRKVSANQFGKELEREMIDRAMEGVADQVHGLAASIVDPETGKHPVVRVRRVGETGLTVSTEGSDAYAELLNGRLIEDGVMGEEEDKEETEEAAVLVYLAHASEDKPDVAVLRDSFVERGIEVWYDEWEIRAGDSLLEKMGQGLEDCSHFVVLLTKTSIEKPWVKEEMNAAFVEKVKGQCKFIGLRRGIAVDELSVFLRAYHVPSVDPDDPESLNRIADDILGVSRKPAAARKQYVRREDPGLAGWSEAAAAVAKVFVESSANASGMDPMLGVEEISEKAGISEEAVKDGLLDLIDAGLARDLRHNSFTPEDALFVEFDGAFMDWNPKDDGLSVARLVVSGDDEQARPEELADKLGWPPRRMNAALYALASARLANLSKTMRCGPWCCAWFRTDQRTRRYVRENS